MKPEHALLLEILALLERYKTEDWNAALQRLRNKEFRRRFTSALGFLADLSKQSGFEDRSTRKLLRNQAGSNRFEKMSNEQLRKLLTENNVKCTTKDSRQKLIRKLSGLKKIVASQKDTAMSGDYENWVNIIMRRK